MMAQHSAIELGEDTPLRSPISSGNELHTCMCDLLDAGCVVQEE
jgi:hypothetical protein